jgi:hypothetical protein
MPYSRFHKGWQYSQNFVQLGHFGLSEISSNLSFIIIHVTCVYKILMEMSMYGVYNKFYLVRFHYKTVSPVQMCSMFMHRQK